MKNNNLIPVILGIVSVILALTSFILLPETVVTQFSVGSSNVTTMPKLFAVALPTLLSLGGAVWAFVSEKSAKHKPIIVSAVGIAVFILMLAVNLQA